MRRIFPIPILFLALYVAGCNLFQKAEIVRIQNQRSSANKYAAGDWMERRDAVREIVNYLGKEKNDLIIGTLMVAAHDLHTAVRIEAVKGLTKISPERSIPVIKKMASEDREGNVRWYALKSLQTFNDPSTAGIYVKGLESEDWLIREESIRGILALDEKTIRAGLIPSIIKALNDPSSSVVITALKSITIKDARLYQVIADKFNSYADHQFSLLEASLHALEGYRLDAKTREKVINLLVHNSNVIRVLALRVLKQEKKSKVPEK